MRIGYFVPGWPPDKVPNGITATLGRLSAALEQLGHEVYFLTPRLVEGTIDPRVSVIRLKVRPSLIDRLRWRFDFEQTLFNTTAMAIRGQLLQLIAKRQIDIFEMEETQGWVNIVAKDLPIPVVTRLHGPWFTQAGINFPQPPPKSARIRIEREGMAICSSFAVSAPSNAVLASARDFYGQITKLSKVIANPMPQAAQKKIWSYEACDKSNILFIGRFDELKGGDIVLRAFSELARMRPNLRLTFVGPDKGVKLRNGELVHLSEFVRREVSAEAATRINYLGTLSPSEIDALRSTAALTIVASRYENFPNTVCEAMSIGGPIVATTVGGIPELLQDNRNAILIEPGKPEALVSACVTLHDNPQLAVRLAAQARTDSSNRFRSDEIALKHVEFYAGVIEQFTLNNLQTR